MSTTVAIPLFPLHSVLFPNGALPFRIFEPRYLEMISDCLKHNQGFGVCLIRTGSETGNAAEVYDTGTLSEITYFNTQPDGLLGITASGKQRFEIISKQIKPNQLMIAEVQLLPNEPETSIPEEYAGAVELLRKLFQQLSYPFAKIEKRYHDASWVGCRLAELLPLDLEKKQQFLQLNDPVERLSRIWQLLGELELR